MCHMKGFISLKIRFFFSPCPPSYQKEESRGMGIDRCSWRKNLFCFVVVVFLFFFFIIKGTKKKLLEVIFLFR